jgi:hypothetical protein
MSLEELLPHADGNPEEDGEEDEDQDEGCSEAEGGAQDEAEVALASFISNRNCGSHVHLQAHPGRSFFARDGAIVRLRQFFCSRSASVYAVVNVIAVAALTWRALVFRTIFDSIHLRFN